MAASAGVVRLSSSATSKLYLAWTSSRSAICQRGENRFGSR
jgi:hypothetical protein